MDINYTKLITAPGAGNGLAAISDLEAGDLIIEIANPYIVVVEKASLNTICSECLLEAEKLKRCARCKVPQYCSTTCQKMAWTSIHRLECSVLAKMPDVPPTPVRALSMLNPLSHPAASRSAEQMLILKRTCQFITDSIVSQCKCFSLIPLVPHPTLVGMTSKPTRNTYQRQIDTLVSCFKRQLHASMQNLLLLMH